MNLRQERLLSRRSQLGRERFKCWNAWCSWHRQRHERGRYRCVALSLFTDPAVHHVRVQAMRQGHTTDAGPRLGTQGKYLCLELLAVFTPAWAVLIQRLFHRLHDPPSWGRCPLHAGSSRWDRRALTLFTQRFIVIFTKFSDAFHTHPPGYKSCLQASSYRLPMRSGLSRTALQPSTASSLTPAPIACKSQCHPAPVVMPHVMARGVHPASGGLFFYRHAGPLLQ